jgi:hypothetical protein
LIVLGSELVLRALNVNRWVLEQRSLHGIILRKFASILLGDGVDKSLRRVLVRQEHRFLERPFSHGRLGFFGSVRLHSYNNYSDKYQSSILFILIHN